MALYTLTARDPTIGYFPQASPGDEPTIEAYRLGLQLKDKHWYTPYLYARILCGQQQPLLQKYQTAWIRSLEDDQGYWAGYHLYTEKGDAAKQLICLRTLRQDACIGLFSCTVFVKDIWYLGTQFTLLDDEGHALVTPIIVVSTFVCSKLPLEL